MKTIKDFKGFLSLIEGIYPEDTPILIGGSYGQGLKHVEFVGSTCVVRDEDPEFAGDFHVAYRDAYSMEEIMALKKCGHAFQALILSEMDDVDVTWAFESEEIEEE